MRMEIFLDGEHYFGKRTEKEDAGNLSDKFYEVASNMDSFRMELEDGSFLVLGKDATQRAHIIFRI
jgi:hypothetical protein